MTVDAIWVLLAGILGAVLGSHYGLLLDRLPREEPTLGGRSACRSCGTALAVRDLVPVLSFFVLRGRCRHCAAPIPRQALHMELAGVSLGVLGALAAPGPLGLAAATLGVTLWALLMFDAHHFWLPDRLTLPLLGLGLAVAAVQAQGIPIDGLLGAALGYGGLHLVAIAYRFARGREGLGGGDAKLLAASGAWLGWQGVPLVLLIGASGLLVWAIARALLRRDVRADTPLPLGVGLAAGTWAVWIADRLGWISLGA
jgi:leader peptidase (prepilin peptidase)/N-methyltransferase